MSLPDFGVRRIADYRRKYVTRPHCDLYEWWTDYGSDRGDGETLDVVSAAFGFAPSPGAGADVFDAYQRGDFTYIADRATADASKTFGLYTRLSPYF